jgi:hypothetical protein
MYKRDELSTVPNLPTTTFHFLPASPSAFSGRIGASTMHIKKMQLFIPVAGKLCAIGAFTPVTILPQAGSTSVRFATQRSRKTIKKACTNEEVSESK